MLRGHAMPETCRPRRHPLQAVAAANIKLPACLFPISCVYIAPILVSYTCGVPVVTALAKVGKTCVFAQVARRPTLGLAGGPLCIGTTVPTVPGAVQHPAEGHHHLWQGGPARHTPAGKGA